MREQQRVTGMDERAADDVVTLVINHLTHLAEQAPWSTGNPRLPESAIDETLRHAMLGDDVASAPARQACARYWAARTARASRRQDPSDIQAGMHAGQLGITAWLDARAAWAERA